MHLKRHKSPKNWPIYRKGTKYIVRSLSNLEKSVPILIILRDMLGFVQNRKEAKSVIHKKNILLNNKPVSDEKNAVSLFDVIEIVPMKKNYRLELSEKGKIMVKEIDKKEAQKKVSKISNKTILKGKKVQLNLLDGRNFISDIKCKTGDSVLIDLDKNKIEKHLPLKEKVNAFVFAGKHAGKRGKINQLDMEKKMAEIDYKGSKVNVLIKQIIIVE